MDNKKILIVDDDLISLKLYESKLKSNDYDVSLAQDGLEAGQNVKGKVTVYLKNVEVEEALKIIVEAYGWAYTREDNIIKVMTASDYEVVYGHKFGQATQTRIKQLLFANTADILATLNQVKSNVGKVITDEKTNTLILIDTPSKLEEMEVIIKKLDVPVKTEVFVLNYSKAEEMSTQIAETLTPALGKVKFDSRSNRIIVSDTPQKLKQVKKIIDAFDQKDKEVLIEAKILQIQLSNDHKMGIDWEAIVSDYKSLDLLSDFDILNATDKKGKLSIGTIAHDDYTILIEALDTIGVTDILSSPRITTINEKEAKILVGSNEPYVTTSTTTPSTGSPTTAESVNFIEVGVKLYVTPTIHNDGFITMQIKPEVSSVTSNVTTSNNNTIPVVETSEAETNVLVKNGVTIVIGGLIKEEKIKTTKKVPLLGDIPLLKVAFQSEHDYVKKTEIVIFLTPTIISGDVEDYGSLTAF